MKILKQTCYKQFEYIVEYKGHTYRIYDKGTDWNDTFIPRYSIEEVILDKELDIIDILFEIEEDFTVFNEIIKKVVKS